MYYWAFVMKESLLKPSSHSENVPVVVSFSAKNNK